MAKILIIDDEPKLVKQLCCHLEADGHEVVIAYTGEEGLAAALLHAPELVILDYAMPGLDGLETCCRLKGSASNPAVPMIVIASQISMADTVNVLKAGAVDFVSSPVSPFEITAMVRTLLQQRGVSQVA